ncbi:Protein of unknown function (DUF3040) [Motilibacter peucedani]|uniref:DUF3040 family protein n=1 Tax=Motilibacter peucedani TaxID=598650 RepID=A0A420XPG5_9ACTN|nr:DUF3040 domain-containing protein [Motilibacter peucedani]RKS74101.1 Protein of unknown function (DUF3040) [Motilibacter peucedani]
MPLSDHEQRLLEQMERALYAEDPKFASALRGSDLRRMHRRRVLKAAVGVFVGIALLLTGVITKVIALGVLGSILMILSALLAVHSWRQIPGPDGATPAAPGRAPSGPRGRGPRGSRPIMQRIEDRWNRRREGNGF